MWRDDAVSWESLGLYIHVPYCSFACHYCDFAKTANFTGNVAEAYFANLKAHLQKWLAIKPQNAKFSSVFFGGGTPGLFADEFAPIMDLVAAHLTKGAEVSLEANPNNCEASRLQAWRDLGFTRLSMGVQTLDPAGLKVMTRDHSGAEALRALNQARMYFDNINADLIYGWPGQTPDSWRHDLETVASMTQHMSLYNLTFESRTPLGRAHARGRIDSAREDAEEGLYETARQVLGAMGYEHDEVSNWSLPGFTCRHNWLYWLGRPYIGVGAGAHGFVPVGASGTRYFYGRSDRAFMRLEVQEETSDEDLGARFGVTIDHREVRDLARELIATSVRTRAGVNQRRIRGIVGNVWQMTPRLQLGMDQGLMHTKGDHLIFHPKEWFREQAWVHEVIQGWRL